MYQKNLQGDVINIIDESGSIVTTYTYSAFGEVLSISGTLASTIGARNPFRYRSYYYDVETGWYYLNSRYYDPTVGRFINADGILGANGGILGYNMFAYCNNNPVMFADHSGFGCYYCSNPSCDGYCDEGTTHEYIDEYEYFPSESAPYKVSYAGFIARCFGVNITNSMKPRYSKANVFLDTKENL